MNRWSDDRLDELSRRTDAGFLEMRHGFTRVDAEIKEGFARVDREMKEGFARVDQKFERFDERFERIEERLERLNHTLVAVALGFAGTVLAATLSGIVAL